jgi:hypothetical protein
MRGRCCFGACGWRGKRAGGIRGYLVPGVGGWRLVGWLFSGDWGTSWGDGKREERGLRWERDIGIGDTNFVTASEV